MGGITATFVFSLKKQCLEVTMSADGSRVFVVDEDATARDSLVRLLESAGFKAESYAHVCGFLKCAKMSGGACALIALRVPECNGHGMLNQIIEQSPQLPVIVVSEHGDVRTAVKAIKSGAWDFIEKPIDKNAVLESVRSAITDSAGGRRRMRVLEEFKGAIKTLTRRELEVYELVIAGKTSPGVAKRLYISTRTVSAHRASIKAKTGIASAAQLIRLGLQTRESALNPHDLRVP